MPDSDLGLYLLPSRAMHVRKSLTRLYDSVDVSPWTHLRTAKSEQKQQKEMYTCLFLLKMDPQRLKQQACSLYGSLPGPLCICYVYMLCVYAVCMLGVLVRLSSGFPHNKL